ncbi:unnamed protein product, partial [Rotaria socialis]
MPDILINLINFDFYIVSKCIFLLSTNDIEKIIDSFKTDRFVFNDQSTNVNCYLDSIMSHQHLSSTIINKPKIFDGIIDYLNIFDLQHVRYINVDLRPSIYLFLKQFDVLFPHIDCIKFKMGKCSIILAIF